MKSDKAIGMILIVFSAFMYYQAENLPPAKFGALGADFFPKILFVLLAVFGAALSISRFVQERKKPAAVAKDVQIEKTADRLLAGLAYYKFVIIGFVAFFFYIVLMHYLGYLISTLIFMPGLMFILGPRTKSAYISIFAVTLGLTLFLYYAFVHLLKVFLPEGAIF